MADLPHWGRWAEAACVYQGVALLNKVWQVWWHRDILQQGAPMRNSILNPNSFIQSSQPQWNDTDIKPLHEVLSSDLILLQIPKIRETHEADCLRWSQWLLL